MATPDDGSSLLCAPFPQHLIMTPWPVCRYKRDNLNAWSTFFLLFARFCYISAYFCTPVLAVKVGTSMHTVLATVWFIENRLLSRRNYRHLTMIIWFKYNFIQHRTENLTEKYVLNNAKKLHLKHCPVTVQYCNYSEVHQHRPTVDWENLAPCSAAVSYTHLTLPTKLSV